MNVHSTGRVGQFSDIAYTLNRTLEFDRIQLQPVVERLGQVIFDGRFEVSLIGLSNFWRCGC